MSAEVSLQAALDRLRAGMREVTISRTMLGVAARDCAGSFRNMGEAMAAAYDRELAGHPDLAELNVSLDGFYSDDL